MASSRRGEKDKIRGPQFSKKNKNKKKETILTVSVQRRPVCSSSHLHIQLENETKITRASSFTVPSLCEKPLVSTVSVCLSVREWARQGGEEVRSSLLPPEAREERLSGKQEAEQSHGEAHPGGKILALVLHEHVHVILVELVSDLPELASDLSLDAHRGTLLVPLLRDVLFLLPALFRLHRPLPPVLHRLKLSGEMCA